MARYYQLFIGTDESAGRVASVLSEMVGISFTQEIEEGYDDGRAYYAFAGPRFYADLFVAGGEFDDDRDMQFSKFDLYLRIRVKKGRTVDEYEMNRSSAEEFGQVVYSGLKSTGRYSLLFTYEMQEKINEFWPIEST